MRLRVKPIYGWGWYGPGDDIFEVPPPFELDADAQGDAVSFREALGQVTIQGHPLHGMWIFLSQRHVTADGHFNLSAYSQKPEAPTTPSKISGFAIVECCN
jgi:hypothetical protein